MKRFVPAFCLLFTAVVFVPAETSGQGARADLSSDGVASALHAIRPEAIEAHIRFLADDLLEGRAPGSRGFEIASRYVETHFRTLGLHPAGVEGGFIQPVPLRESSNPREEQHRIDHKQTNHP